MPPSPAIGNRLNGNRPFHRSRANPPRQVASPLTISKIYDPCYRSSPRSQSPSVKSPESIFPGRDRDCDVDMADPAQSTKPQGESANPDAQSTSHPVPEGSGRASEATSQDSSSSLPPVDPALSAADSSLPPVDPSLPSVGTSISPVEPSLSAIDTSLSPLDTTLPATEAKNPAGAAKSGNPNGARAENTATAALDSDNDATRQLGHHTPAAPGQSPNGMYRQPQQQHSPPAPQQSQFHHQSPGMSHNSQARASPMNAGSIQPGGHVQEQYIPQAPIGSPLPTSMPPMGQYMAGYPTNMLQMGLNSNAQMRYQMPGDANRMLSGGRHKKEVKRRTKTGCLTCRKRRIKVCIMLRCVGVPGRQPTSAGLARFASHQNPRHSSLRPCRSLLFLHNATFSLFWFF